MPRGLVTANHRHQSG